MAKRRNIKKEKAARNRAYAKQFKKKTGRNKNFRTFQNKQEGDSELTSSDNTD